MINAFDIDVVTEKGREEEKSFQIEGLGQRKQCRNVWRARVDHIDFLLDLEPFMKNEGITFLVKWYSFYLDSQLTESN